MRKIESLMNDAITNGTDFRSANTNVVQADGIAVVLLHGNKIAEVGDNFVRLFDGGWQSNTTKSRLNAILQVHGIKGECVFQKKGQWFLNYAGNGVIPFFSGMRLAQSATRGTGTRFPPDPLLTPYNNSMKNTHLEHPEDSILTGDLTVLDWFIEPGALSVKIDGAPAVVFGTNPANGKFFVGTKSVFNKVKIKILPRF